MSIRFDDRVAIITGGGNGLGREHCLALAERGARVVVNDLGGSVDGTGASSSAAESVAEAIRAAGGEAIGNGADITDFEQVEAMVAEAKAKWGRVDILINNAGILRDKSFAKMGIADFKKVVDVHLFGTVPPNNSSALISLEIDNCRHSIADRLMRKFSQLPEVIDVRNAVDLH